MRNTVIVLLCLVAPMFAATDAFAVGPPPYPGIDSCGLGLGSLYADHSDRIVRGPALDGKDK